MADSLDEMTRLRCALEAVTADLDAIEGRPHLALRLAAQHLAEHDAPEIQNFVGHFASAMVRSHSR